MKNDESERGSVVQTLSHNQTARALRAFTVASLFWGAWGRIIGVGTAAFTGYLIWIGANDAQVAYFVSIASFVSLAQVISPYLSKRLKRPKVFVIGVGITEMAFRFSLVLVPLLVASEHRVEMAGLLLGIGLVFGHLVSPVYSGWLSGIVPEASRGRFIGRQTNANTVAGMVAGYVAGLYLDRFVGPSQYTAFILTFGVATLLGVAGYLRVARVPYNPPVVNPSGVSLLVPFRTPAFRRLTLFFLAWNFALGVGGPFYTLYMLRQLHLSYTTVALLNSLFLGAMILGYRTLGSLVDRFGSRAVLNILVPPTAVTTLMWCFSSSESYIFVVVAMTLNGLLHAGILTAVGSTLFGSIPSGEDKTPFFAAWSIAINLAVAVSPLLGSAIVSATQGVTIQVLGFGIGSIQIVFAVSAGLLAVSLFFLPGVSSTRTSTSRELLSRLARGNLLSYVYGALLYDRAERESVRARAMRWLGRSRSPMALERLIAALDDASPAVRREAARGLGDTREPSALAHLLEELADTESDIRDEAVSALGRIGDPAVVEPLLRALDDPDLQIRISAVNALASITNGDTSELLFLAFADCRDTQLIPTLVDALAGLGDVRVVRPTLQRVAEAKSPAIRLQLLRGVCRAIGAGNGFYRLLSTDILTRAEAIDGVLNRICRRVRKSRALPPDARSEVLAQLEGAGRRRLEESALLTPALSAIADTIAGAIGPKPMRGITDPAAAQLTAAILALRTFREEAESRVAPDVGEAFTLTCMTRIADLI